MKVTTRTRKHYRLVFSLIEDMPNSYSSETFDSYSQAAEHWEKTCRDRNKGDEYDNYWRNIPLMIAWEIEIQTLIIP